LQQQLLVPLYEPAAVAVTMETERRAHPKKRPRKSDIEFLSQWPFETDFGDHVREQTTLSLGVAGTLGRVAACVSLDRACVGGGQLEWVYWSFGGWSGYLKVIECD